jgi:L-fuculose-phosphate aldolase
MLQIQHLEERLANSEWELRAGIVDACRRMNALGINQGTSGNISARWNDGLLISPSGVDYADLTPDQIVFIDYDGNYEGVTKPSSEWRFHARIAAKKPEVGSVVHTHATYCTTLAIRGMPIPAVHYMVAVAGGTEIPCVPYTTFGTTELADMVVAALSERTACLLANHGMIATGADLKKALWLAVEVETLARQYFNSLLIGGPNLLSAEQIEATKRRFDTYGQTR